MLCKEEDGGDRPWALSASSSSKGVDDGSAAAAAGLYQEFHPCGEQDSISALEEGERERKRERKAL